MLNLYLKIINNDQNAIKNILTNILFVIIQTVQNLFIFTFLYRYLKYLIYLLTLEVHNHKIILFYKKQYFQK